MTRHFPLLLQYAYNRLRLLLNKNLPCFRLHHISSYVASVMPRYLLYLLNFSPFNSADHLEVLLTSQWLLIDLLNKLKHRLVFYTVPDYLPESVGIQVAFFLFRLYFHNLQRCNEVKINFHLDRLYLLIWITLIKLWHRGLQGNLDIDCRRGLGIPFLYDELCFLSEITLITLDGWAIRNIKGCVVGVLDNYGYWFYLSDGFKFQQWWFSYLNVFLWLDCDEVERVFRVVDFLEMYFVLEDLPSYGSYVSCEVDIFYYFLGVG